MLKADLLLVRGKGPISRAIEDITHSRYSHVAGYVRGRELIEANGMRKVGYQGLDYYDGIGDIYTCDILTDDQRNRILLYVRGQIGKRYDYLLLGVELVRYVFHIMLPYREYNSRICSTLWVDAYRSVGVDLCPGIRYPSPADVAQSKLLRKVGQI